VIVEPAEERPYTIFAQSIDRSGTPAHARAASRTAGTDSGA